MANSIRDTLEVLAQDGWAQGSYVRFDYDDSGTAKLRGRCIIGAMRVATNDYELYTYSVSPEIKLIQSVIKEQFPERSNNNIPDFNDDKRTEVEDVIMVLEKAAIRLDENVE